MYQPFRAAWQMATRSCNTFPPPSVKFRTVGFPQYGFKTRSPRRPSCEHNALRLIRRASATLEPCSHCWHSPRVVCRRTSKSRGPWLAGRLCCPARSSLTMASSETLVSSADLCFIRRASVAQLLPTGRPGLPQFPLRVCNPRAALRTPVDCAIACDCYFIAHTSLRHFRIASAPTGPTKPGHCGVCNEAASFALCYGP
jgi:hypothetical protein